MINIPPCRVRYGLLPVLITFSSLLATEKDRKQISSTARTRLENILQENKYYNFLKDRTICLHNTTDNTSPCIIDEDVCSLLRVTLALPDTELFTILAKTYKKYQLAYLVKVIAPLLTIGAMVTGYWYFLIYRTRCYYQQIIDKECAQIGPVKLLTEIFSDSGACSAQIDRDRFIIINGIDAKELPYTVYHEIGHQVHNDYLWTKRLHRLYNMVTLENARCEPYFKYLLAPFFRYQEKRADLFAAQKLNKTDLKYIIDTNEKSSCSYNNDSFLNSYPPLINKLYHLANYYQNTFPCLANRIKQYCFDPEHSHPKTRVNYMTKVLHGKNG